MVASVLRLLQRQIIVYQNSLWESEGVNVDSVNSRSAQLFVLIDEEFLDAARELSKGCNSRNEPAIPNELLVQALRVDAFLWEQIGCLEDFTCPPP